MKTHSLKEYLPRWSGGLVMLCIWGFGSLLPAQNSDPADPVAQAAPEKAAPEKEDRSVLLLEALAESRPAADTRQVRFDLKTGRVIAYLVGHVEWTYRYKGETVHLLADRLVLEARRVESGPSDGSVSKAAAESAAADDAPPGGAVDGLSGIDLPQDFRFFADGNVRIAIPDRDTFFEADSFYYEHLTGKGVARGVRLKTTYTAAQGAQSAFQAKSFTPGQPDAAAGEEEEANSAQLSVHADLLRMEGFERFSGEGVEVSTCDYAVPHYALRAATVEVRPVPAPEGQAAAGAPAGAARAIGRGPEDGPREPDTEKAPGELELALTPDWARDGAPGRDYIIDPESTWLSLSGHRITPVPVSRWDTRWHSQMPVRSVDMGGSNQFGLFLGVNWNVNYALSLLPLENFLPLSILEEKTELGFETSGMEKRGFGYGPNAKYGTKTSRWDPWQLQLDAWNYYGETQYYHVDDQGDEDRTTGEPPPREERYWGHLWHRQSIPYLGLLELEYSKISDRAFLDEYFEEIQKEEKEQETLAYLQRNVNDNLALTGLYQVRVNDFQTQTERLPEGKLFLFQQPIFNTGLYSDLNIQGAYLNNRPDNALGLDSTEYGRYDMLNEWSYPFGWNPYFQARPFAYMRYSYYGELVNPAEGSEDRATFGAGVTVSQEWSRIFQLEQDSLVTKVFGASNLKHNVVPRMTYVNTFSNDLDSQDVIQVDPMDDVDVTEQFILGFRNQFITREKRTSATKVRPLLGNRDLELEAVSYSQRPLLDSDVSLALFPQANRDNDGETSSLLIFDNTAAVTPSLYLRGWFELDPNEEFEIYRADGSATYEVIPEKLWFTVGDRYTRSFSEYIYGTLSMSLTQKWDVDLYGSYDVERQKGVEYSLVLSRLFHRFVFSMEYSMDVGEDYNQTVFVTFAPLELWKPARSRASRKFY